MRRRHRPNYNLLLIVLLVLGIAALVSINMGPTGFFGVTVGPGGDITPMTAIVNETFDYNETAHGDWLAENETLVDWSDTGYVNISTDEGSTTETYIENIVYTPWLLSSTHVFVFKSNYNGSGDRLLLSYRASQGGDSVQVILFENGSIDVGAVDGGDDGNFIYTPNTWITVNATVDYAGGINVYIDDSESIAASGLIYNSEDGDGYRFDGPFGAATPTGTATLDWLEVLFTPAPIAECTVITEPGYYAAINNISTSGPGNCIDIQSDDVTFDCANYDLRSEFELAFASQEYDVSAPTSNGTGVHISGNNVTVQNCNISGFDNGVSLDSTADDLLANINASINNYGILLNSSENVNLTNDSMFDNIYNFHIDFQEDTTYLHHYIDASNTVDGNIIYYYDGNGAIGAIPVDAGMVIAVDSAGLTADSLIFQNNGYGILLANTNDSVITNVSADDNTYGVYFFSSANNNITDTNTSNNTYDLAINGNEETHEVSNSKANNHNICNLKNINDAAYDSSDDCISFSCFWCDNVTIKDVTLTKNSHGVVFKWTNNSRIENVTTTLNQQHGIWLQNSHNNTIIDSNLNNNKWGIRLQASPDNTITNNIVSSNNIGYKSESESINDTAVVFLSEQNNITFLSKDISLTGLTPESAPADEPGHQNISKWIEATNNAGDSWMFLNFSYNDSDLNGINPSSLRIWKYSGGLWTNAGFSSVNGVDTENRIVYANVTVFGSKFAPLGDLDVPPQINLNLPENESQFNNTQEVDFNFTVTDDFNLTLSCDIYLDDVLNQTNGSVANDTLTDFIIDGIPYGGPYSWYINCSDGGEASNVSETRYFSINDTQAPQVNLNLPTSGTQINNTQSAMFNFTAIDYQTIDTTSNCSIYLDGILNQTNATTVNNTLTNFQIDGISYGAHNWNVACTDNSDNTNTTANRTLVIADTQAPQIELNLPIANASYFNELDFDFNFTETDNIDTTANCSIYLDGILNQTNATTKNNTLTNFTITALGYGYHNWSIGCIDSSDNENMTANRTLNLTRRIIPPTGGAGGTSPATILNLGAILPGTYKDAGLGFGDSAIFISYGNQHTIRASGIFGDTGELEISSDTFRADFKVGDTKQYDTNGNGINDLEITLLSKTDNSVTLRVKVLSEATTNIPTTATPAVKAAVCGNSICESGETAANCPADCAKTVAYSSLFASFLAQANSHLALIMLALIATVVLYAIWRKSAPKAYK
jgi:parallel beta-helix repeat protein